MALVVRPEAEADVDEAYKWYEARSRGLGQRFLDAVEQTIELLAHRPLTFPEKVREADLVIRRALVAGFPYGIFFICSEPNDTVSVIACMHARREPRRWLDRAT